MNVTIDSEQYIPGIDNTGNYIDAIPMANNGIRCSCGSRKDKVYTKVLFTNHIKTKCHQKWLDGLNTNRANYYVETIRQKELIDNQRIIIQRQSNNIQVKDAYIKNLLSQVHQEKLENGKINLIDI